MTFRLDSNKIVKAKAEDLCLYQFLDYCGSDDEVKALTLVAAGVPASFLLFLMFLKES